MYLGGKIARTQNGNSRSISYKEIEFISESEWVIGKRKTTKLLKVISRYWNTNCFNFKNFKKDEIVDFVL